MEYKIVAAYKEIYEETYRVYADSLKEARELVLSNQCDSGKSELTDSEFIGFVKIEELPNAL